MYIQKIISTIEKKEKKSFYLPKKKKVIRAEYKKLYPGLIRMVASLAN
jgi:hypothetical protein